MAEPEGPVIESARIPWYGRLLPAITIPAWALAFTAQVALFVAEPSGWNRTVLAALLIAFLSGYLQLVILNRRLSGDWRRAMVLIIRPGLRVEDAAADRDSFMADVRREQAHAREAGLASSMVVASIDADAADRRHGERVARAAIKELAREVARVSRATDLIGYLGNGQMCAFLTDCSREEAHHFTRRLPHEITVPGHGRSAISFPVTVTLSEFDTLTGEPIEVSDEPGTDATTELLLRLRMKPQARSAA